MKATEQEKFRPLLLEKQARILENAKNTLDDGMVFDAADLPDEMDHAASESLQSFQLRLRGRERTFLLLIEKALMKIDQAIFGECEECSRQIQKKRLQARPEARLCIQCKEAQEQEERQYRS